MTKVAIVFLADPENLGDMANALSAVQEFKESGDDIRLIFDGAAVKWSG